MHRIEEAETSSAGDPHQAKEFLCFFKDKMEKIRKEISSSPEPTFEQHSANKFSEFAHASAEISSLQLLMLQINIVHLIQCPPC